VIKVAKSNEEVKDTETPEVDETEEITSFTPSEVAGDLNVDPKALRAFLRSTFPRPLEMKNKSWVLTPEMASACIEHFTLSDTEDEEVEDIDELVEA
jgi:hypothetical protein